MKDGVLASVSHELRSPLTAIRGHLKLVSAQAGDRLDESELRSLQVIDRSSERLSRLVEEVLVVAQMRAGYFDIEVAPADLAALARDCVESARPAAAARDVALRLELEADSAPVTADAARIGQVIDNLVSNAIKFSEAGSAVTVSVRRAAGPVELDVADTGVGISLPDLTQLFQPFARGETASLRQVQGTGLGLYISKTIVEAHGGSIHLDSTLGAGTRARVALPATADLEVAA